MKKMEIQKMEMIQGGGTQAGATGLMCGVGVALLLTPAALLSISPLVGCATGLFSMWSTGSWA